MERTVTEAARLAGVTPQAIRHAIKQGRIQATESVQRTISDVEIRRYKQRLARGPKRGPKSNGKGTHK